VTTNIDGNYGFCVEPGTYFVKIPARAFQVGGALYQGLSSPDNSLLSGILDDDLAEDGLDDPEPEVNGIRTANLVLVAGLQPTNLTGETGYQNESDDGADANSNLTIDFGISFNSQAGGAPFQAEGGSFAQWQSENEGHGSTDPEDDADGDGMNNLLEHALGLDPLASSAGLPRFRLERSATGAVDAVLIRPADLPADVRYLIQGATLSGPWQTLSVTPSIMFPGDGTQLARYTGIDSLPVFAPLSTGRVRLTVQLDADLNGTPEASASADRFAFARRTLPTRVTTFSQPLLSPSLFTGQVQSLDGTQLVLTGTDGSHAVRSAMDQQAAYFILVRDGTLAGHRFEVDEAATTASRIALLPEATLNTTSGLPAALAGALISLHEHWTISKLLPRSSFMTGADAATADNVLLFENGAFTTLWAGLSQGSPAWLSGTASANARVLPYGEGVMVHPRLQQVSISLVGQENPAPAAVRLIDGTSLLGSLSLTPHSPQSLGMDSMAGFVVGDEASADRLRVWQADSLPTASGYDAYFYHHSGSWLLEGDATQTHHSATPLLQPWHALFTITHGERSLRVQP
jgi:hypothetical protein